MDQPGFEDVVTATSEHPERVLAVTVPVLKIISVCSSTGLREQRPLIEALIRLGPVTKRVRLTITNHPV